MTTLNHVYRITAHMMFNGVIDVENVFYLRVAVAGTDTDTDVLSAARDWLEDAYLFIANDLSNSLSFVDVRGFNITTDGPIAPVGWTGLTFGGSTADPLATGVSAVITFYTAVSRVRGRKFIGGLVEPLLTSTLWTATVLTDLTNFAITILGGPAVMTGGTNLDWGIWRKDKPFLSVSRFIVSAVPGYQRRRRLNVGS